MMGVSRMLLSAIEQMIPCNFFMKVEEICLSNVCLISIYHVRSCRMYEQVEFREGEKYFSLLLVDPIVRSTICAILVFIIPSVFEV